MYTELVHWHHIHGVPDFFLHHWGLPPTADLERTEGKAPRFPSPDPFPASSDISTIETMSCHCLPALSPGGASCSQLWESGRQDFSFWSSTWCQVWCYNEWSMGSTVSFSVYQPWKEHALGSASYTLIYTISFIHGICTHRLILARCWRYLDFKIILDFKFPFGLGNACFCNLQTYCVSKIFLLL